MSAYLSTIQQAAGAYGVPPQLLAAQLQQESGLNPAAFNPTSGATGIAQFLPSTAAQMGVNPTDPISSIWGAAQYDAQLYQQNGSWVGALQSYGTLPGQGSISSGQAQVWQIAQGLDQGGTGGSSGGGLAGIDPNALPYLGNAPTGPGLGSLGSGWLGSLGSGIQSALGFPSTVMGVVGTYAERALIIMLGIALIGAGALLFKRS